MSSLYREVLMPPFPCFNLSLFMYISTLIITTVSVFFSSVFMFLKVLRILSFFSFPVCLSRHDCASFYLKNIDSARTFLMLPYTISISLSMSQFLSPSLYQSLSHLLVRHIYSYLILRPSVLRSSYSFPFRSHSYVFSLLVHYRSTYVTCLSST